MFKIKSPLVTVLIPMYNCEKYIKDSLNSIINQTYSNLEILIIDDGSTDRSVEIVKSYSDSRIRLIESKENRGIPFTRNLGLNNTRGKYVAMMDADDISLLNRIEKQVDFMESNQNIDVLGTYYEVFGQGVSKKTPGEFKSAMDIKIGLLFFNQIANPTTIIRVETLKKNDLSYNLDYFVAQDYDMWVQISKIGNLFVLPEVLLKYRVGHMNITKKTKKGKVSARKEVINSIHKDILSFYQFNLSNDELIIYNDFFNDNDQGDINQNSVTSIEKVLIKLIDLNKETQTFNENNFIEVMKKSIFTSLSIHNFSVKQKIILYKKFCYRENTLMDYKSIMFLIAKHFHKILT